MRFCGMMQAMMVGDLNGSLNAGAEALGALLPLLAIGYGIYYLVQRSSRRAGHVPLPPPGWYPDPAGFRHLRWWDGYRWTDAVHGPQAVQGPGQGEPGPGQTPKVSSPRRSHPLRADRSAKSPE
jgi:hypothetical protein